jgi:molybdopterin converting factor small subunit
MRVHELSILAFGQSAVYCGGSRLLLDIALPCTVAELRKGIAAKCPLMLPNYMIAINQAYAPDTFLIENTNLEIAIIPPVSGG